MVMHPNISPGRGMAAGLSGYAERSAATFLFSCIYQEGGVLAATVTNRHFPMS